MSGIYDWGDADDGGFLTVFDVTNGDELYFEFSYTRYFGFGGVAKYNGDVFTFNESGNKGTIRRDSAGDVIFTLTESEYQDGLGVYTMTYERSLEEWNDIISEYRYLADYESYPNAFFNQFLCDYWGDYNAGYMEWLGDTNEIFTFPGQTYTRCTIYKLNLTDGTTAYFVVGQEQNNTFQVYEIYPGKQLKWLWNVPSHLVKK
ncbi:MAG: hypothetical protein Q4B73_07095 [Lachnospiraceae bacterium]|nr:hypothetical protein [Lachnospiraceae bacterium]